MHITMLGSKINGIRYDEILKHQPKPTIDDTNEYIMCVDSALKSIPVYDWDSIYGLSIEDRMKLCDMLRMTYLNHDSFSSYKRSDILKPQPLENRIANILKTDGILNEKQVELVLGKTQGAYKPEDVEKHEQTNYLHDKQLQENLEFIKSLLNDDNYPIFEAMSKKTLVDIIFNTTLSGDDLSEALSNLKFDNVLPQYSENKFYLDKEDTRATIHEYLLGESYYKQAYDIDRRYRETFKMRTY